MSKRKKLLHIFLFDKSKTSVLEVNYTISDNHFKTNYQFPKAVLPMTLALYPGIGKILQQSRVPYTMYQKLKIGLEELL